MASRLDRHLERWQAAGIIDSAIAERIRAFESQRAEQVRHRRPIGLVLGLGGMMVAAGVMLFVAAHWQQLSPTSRFLLVLLLVASFHLLGGAAAERLPVLSKVFHAVGTGCLGAGIFLSAQIFNLEEDWAAGFLLWGIGAALAWLIRRDWIQFALAALLFPIWAVGEWNLQTWGYAATWRIGIEGVFLLALAYLTAVTPAKDSAERRSLCWMGWIAVIPLAIWMLFPERKWWETSALPLSWKVFGWGVAVAVPLFLAVILRGASWRALSYNLAAIPWVLILGTIDVHIYPKPQGGFLHFWHSQGAYVWCGIGALGMIASGVADSRKERINLGLLGFAATIVVFYFSSVMSKLGRSISLIGLGVLFLLLGIALHEARKRLLKRMAG